MSIVYSQEYLEQLAAARTAQQTSAAFLEINDVAINYNTEYEAFEAMASTENPWREAWYYDPVKNSSGDIIGMDYVQVPTSVENPPAVINSNTANPVFTTGGNKVRINGSSGGTAPNKFSKGAKVLSTNLPTSTLASKVGLAIAAVSLGTKLGKSLSEGIYELGGGWQYDPANWSSMLIGDDIDELDKAALRILFGCDENNNVTPYLNSDALGSMYLMLLASNAFNTGGEVVPESLPQSLGVSAPIGTGYSANNGVTYGATIIYNGNPLGLGYQFPNGVPSDLQITSMMDATGAVSVIAASSQPFTFKHTRVNLNTGAYQYTAGVRNASSYTFNNTTVYYSDSAGVNADYGTAHTPLTSYNASNYTLKKQVAWAIIFGTIATSAPGIADDTTGATYFPNPNTITGTDLDTVNQQLRQNYPQLYDGEIYEDVPQPDGTNKRITYIPVPFPNTSDKTKPITGDNHQNNPTSNPTTNTEEQLKDIIDLITQLTTPNLNPNPDIPTNPTPPDTGSGNTPPIVVPSGGASSLWKIYNPTQAQVDAFGAWLWDSSFVEQIKRLFSDPMQAIIGIHKVFATPSIGGTTTIKVGYLDSQVSSAWVDNQYSTVDCGSVNLREYFGNVFDYAPYTKIQLYLPFIGIVDLDVGDVMRSTISVKYHVDVLTGACLADVHVKRDNVGGVLYQFAGSAIVTYPVSSGTYLGVIAGIGAVATGAVASIMTGGLAGAALGVAGTATGLSHLHANVGHSGGFSGCAGAMGSKKPYIIISRPQIALANKYEHYTGIPANSFVNINDCNGYTKVKAVYVNSITRATEDEKNMIEAELKAGVLV